MNKTTTNRILFVLSLAGLGDSIYLTLAHTKLAEIKCGPSHGCEDVALHYTAMGFGIPGLNILPTAAYGVMMYVALCVAAFLRVVASDKKLIARLSLFQLIGSLVGVLASGYLTYLEKYVIKAWCKFCVVSAIIITLHFIVTLLDRRATDAVLEALPELEGVAS